MNIFIRLLHRREIRRAWRDDRTVVLENEEILKNLFKNGARPVREHPPRPSTRRTSIRSKS